MTREQIDAWATRAGIAVPVMITQPAMMESIIRMVGIAIDRNPALARNDHARTALTILAWEQLSAVANSAAAQPQTAAAS